MGAVAGCRQHGDEAHSSQRPSTSDAREAPWFVDRAAQVGLVWQLDSGARGKWYFPEIMSGGAAWVDVDNDGWLDVYLVQSGPLDAPDAERPPNRLFRNIGGRFEDITEGSGADDRGYGMGVACGDYDNDGLVDLYVTNVGPNVLLRNLGGGRFRDVTAEAGVGDPHWGSSAAFVDYDRDGWLDLFVVNYVGWTLERDTPCFTVAGQRDYCGPKSYNLPERDVLYRNNGDGTFTDVTEVAGIAEAFGNGLGVVCADFNGDGWVDIYVANDQTENQLWINHAGEYFTDEALVAGCALNMAGRAEAGMGVICEDFDDNGWPDLFMTHLKAETNTLYLNDGGVFTDATARTGLGPASLPYTGFGVGALDVEADGWLDLFIANGRVAIHPAIPGGRDVFSEPNQLFRGGAGCRFTDVSRDGGEVFALIETSRGAAFGDYDNDGDVDILVVNRDAPLRLLENVHPGRGRWVGFEVVDEHGRAALGAVVEVWSQGRHRQRIVRRAYSYLCSNDPRVVFGLGDARSVERVRVRWPDGRTREMQSVASGQYVRVPPP